MRSERLSKLLRTILSGSYTSPLYVFFRRGFPAAFCLFLGMAFVAFPCVSQNSLFLFSENGKVFRVRSGTQEFNAKPQAHVLIENIASDSLRLEFEFENRKKFSGLFYLLDKGRTCRGQEFSYRVQFDDIHFRLSYAGVHERAGHPVQIVPAEPPASRRVTPKRRALDRLCETREGGTVYFHNIPGSGTCDTAMPAVYLDHIALLMSEAPNASVRLDILDKVCRHNCLSVAQMEKLLGYVEYDLEKVRLIRRAYPALVDKQELPRLEKSLRMGASIAEIRTLYPAVDTSRSALPAGCSGAASQMLADTYASQVARKDNDAERLEFLRSSYTTLCYSTAQVSLLLSRFSHDREKLAAARLLYFYCVEKENFMRVAELFSEAHSREELRGFLAEQTR